MSQEQKQGNRLLEKQTQGTVRKLLTAKSRRGFAKDANKSFANSRALCEPGG
jgi:hypothetical protein